MKRQKTTASVLCANKDGNTVRVAVQVKTGKTIERVVILRVERQPEGMDRPWTDAEIAALAMQKAEYPCLKTAGTTVLSSAYDGTTLTGLGQPKDGE